MEKCPTEREWSTACLLCLNRWKGSMYSLLSQIFTAWMSAVSMFLMFTLTSHQSPLFSGFFFVYNMILSHPIPIMLQQYKLPAWLIYYKQTGWYGFPCAWLYLGEDIKWNAPRNALRLIVSHDPSCPILVLQTSFIHYKFSPQIKYHLSVLLSLIKPPWMWPGYLFLSLFCSVSFFSR